MRATVQTFNGTKEFAVKRVWFWNGKPERLWTECGMKFKMDEEPFVIAQSSATGDRSATWWQFDARTGFLVWDNDVDPGYENVFYQTHLYGTVVVPKPVRCTCP